MADPVRELSEITARIYGRNPDIDSDSDSDRGLDSGDPLVDRYLPREMKQSIRELEASRRNYNVDLDTLKHQLSPVTVLQAQASAQKVSDTAVALSQATNEFDSTMSSVDNKQALKQWINLKDNIHKMRSQAVTAWDALQELASAMHLVPMQRSQSLPAGYGYPSAGVHGGQHAPQRGSNRSNSAPHYYGGWGHPGAAGPAYPGPGGYPVGRGRGGM